jgi:hypothetical protein
MGPTLDWVLTSNWGLSTRKFPLSSPFGKAMNSDRGERLIEPYGDLDLPTRGFRLLNHIVT